MKLAKITMLIGSLIVSLGVRAEPTIEVLMGLDIQPKALLVHVASGGCTSAKDFEVKVNKGVTGKPPYIVTIKRIKPDNCKALVRGGIKLSFDRKRLGLEGNIEFNVTNRFGNTSQHR